MSTLASILDYFNDVDDADVLRLREEAIAILVRVESRLSPNVAGCENNLGAAYQKRARRAHAAHDLDRCIANLELAVPRVIEAARIFRAINHVENADKVARDAATIEKDLQQIITKRAETRKNSGNL